MERLAGMRILVAEDEPVSRRITQATLSRIGFDVVTASDGEAAWRILETESGSNAPQIVVLDWMMPGIDGVEICRRMRATPRLETIYVILVTARSEKEDLAMGLAAGANDYIAKPFDPIELESRVRVGKRMVGLQETLQARIVDLEQALAHVHKLQGLLPMCSYCKKVRDESNYWQQVEAYLTSNSDLELSHSVCPTCLERVMREIDEMPAE
jgi:sigma-B regulation protein RsbU (phosphoserine phosphatase)